MNPHIIMSSIHDNFVIKPSPIHGNGLFATRAFDAGITLFSLEGQKLSSADAAVLSPKQRDNLIQIGNDLFLNLEGGHSFFLNHSCRPNTYIKVVVGTAFACSIIPIKVGDEITIHYSLLAPQGKELMECRCGISFGCNGLVGGFDDLDGKVKADMGKFLPAFRK